MAGTRKAAAATLIVLAGASLRSPLMAQSGGESGGPVLTTCRLLLGRPAGGAAQGAALNRRSDEAARQGMLSGPDAARASKELVELSDRLRANFNLATMELSASVSVPVSLNQEVSAEGTGGFRLLVALRAIGGSELTYQVRVLQGERAVLDKDMVVERGHRTMFAKQTGNEGETAFVVLEAAAQAEQAASAPQTRPDLPAYRVSVTLVPLDVRVVDRDGHFVTNLRQEDFTVIEDGVRQKIAHFLPCAMPRLPVEAGAAPPLRQPPGDSISPDTNRLFLIVLGRGRLQEPFKGVDALIGFVRERLLPQDRVAVLAFDRASDITTDHESIARLLERFRSGHEFIEQRLRLAKSGLPGLFAPGGIPQGLRREIDDLFTGPGLPQTRQLPSAGGPASGDIMDEMRSNIWDLFDTRPTSLARDRVLDAATPVPAWSLDRWTPSDTGSWGNSDSIPRTPGRVATETMNLERIFAGIEFMRYLAGEKHLVFVTERNFVLSRKEYDDAIGAMANDADVIIDTIQTGGLTGPSVHSTLENIADLTGGMSELYQYPRVAVERLDLMTRFKYVLAYHPSNPARDGRYRKVAVTVNRPGVTVLFRHGYYASDVLVPSDRRAFVAYRRILSAGQAGEIITDIGLKVKASAPRKTAAAPGETLVTGTIDAARIGFTKAAGRYAASLDLAAFCADAREAPLGEAWQKIDLNLSEATYRRVMREGIPYSIRVPVRSEPRWSKVVVYDYASDLLGSATEQLRQ